MCKCVKNKQTNKTVIRFTETGMSEMPLAVMLTEWGPEYITTNSEYSTYLKCHLYTWLVFKPGGDAIM